jgi:hypothetical protein
MEVAMPDEEGRALHAEMPQEIRDLAARKLERFIRVLLDAPDERKITVSIEATPIGPEKSALNINAEPKLTAEETKMIYDAISMLNDAWGGRPLIVKS